MLQLALLGWDQKTRCKWASIYGKDTFEGFWDMVPCTFNPCYRQLALYYPEELTLSQPHRPRHYGHSHLVSISPLSYVH